MIEVATFNFRLRLEHNHDRRNNKHGAYIIVLTGESPFDVNKAFSETFIADAERVPFNTKADAGLFAEKQAGWWKLQLMTNPALSITCIQEWADLWQKFVVALRPFYPGGFRQTMGYPASPNQ